MPTRDALRFVGEPTWAALSGEPVTTEVWSGVARGPARTARAGRRPGVRGPGHRRPAGQGRARPRRRPADQHPAHRPVPGRVRARDAHRDVGAPGHPGQRRDAARARRDRHRARRPAGSPAPTPAPGRLPEPAELFEVARRVLARGAPRPATWPAATSSSRRAAPARRSTRSGSSATAPPACRGTPWRGPPLARGARVTLVAANVALPDPAGADVVRAGSAAEMRDGGAQGRGRRRRRGHGRGGGRLPACRLRGRQDQEDRPVPSRTRSASSRTPTSSPSWSVRTRTGARRR